MILFISRLRFTVQSGAACVPAMEDMSSSFSSLAIMVLVVNFSNPYKKAGFLSFIKKEDAT